MFVIEGIPNLYSKCHTTKLSDIIQFNHIKVKLGSNFDFSETSYQRSILFRS